MMTSDDPVSECVGDDGDKGYDGGVMRTRAEARGRANQETIYYTAPERLFFPFQIFSIFSNIYRVFAAVSWIVFSVLLLKFYF